MAKRNDTSKSGPTRNPTPPKIRSASRPAKPAGKSASVPNLDALGDTIEEERARLMEAHSMLNCVAIAMDTEDVNPGDGPHYPTLIETACDLINKSICRLDAVNLGRAMKTREDAPDDEDEDELEDELTVKRGRKSEVREPPPVYGYGRSPACAAAGQTPVVPEPKPKPQDELVPDRTVH